MELAALYWSSGWKPVPTDAFRQHTLQTLGGTTWIVDGNDWEVRDIQDLIGEPVQAQGVVAGGWVRRSVVSGGRRAVMHLRRPTEMSRDTDCPWPRKLSGATRSLDGCLGLIGFRADLLAIPGA